MLAVRTPEAPQAWARIVGELETIATRGFPSKLNLSI